MNNGGDQLARGCIKAQFPPAGGKMTKEQWDDIFEGYDPEKYRSDANSEASGDACFELAEPPRDETGS